MTTARIRFIITLCLFVGSPLASVFLSTAYSQDKSVVYDTAYVDKKPEPKRRIRPEYPDSIKKRTTPAEITLRFVVAVDGSVQDIVVVKFNDADMIDCVYSAYEEARYTPGEKNGVKVPTRIEVTEIYPQPKKK